MAMVMGAGADASANSSHPEVSRPLTARSMRHGSRGRRRTSPYSPSGPARLSTGSHWGDVAERLKAAVC